MWNLFSFTRCHVPHHTQTLVGREEMEKVSVSPQTQTPQVLRMMHILSLIIHPYVKDERILVWVSGTGNVWGGGLFKAQMTGFLQESEPPSVHSAGWDETHQDSPLWCGEELGKWTFSEYRIIRESWTPRQPSKVWIPQDSGDTLNVSQSLSSLPLDTKDNEGAAFPLLYFMLTTTEGWVATGKWSTQISLC